MTNQRTIIITKLSTSRYRMPQHALIIMYLHFINF